MNMQSKLTARAALMGATAMVLVSLPASADDQTCLEVLGQPLAEDCTQANAGLVVEMPIGTQLEPDTGPVSNGSGFVLAIDGGNG